MRISRYLPNGSNNTAVLYMTFGTFSFATMGALTHALGQKIDWMIIAFFRMFLTFIFITAVLAK